jgi:flagellar basal body rod protein FlgC
VPLTNVANAQTIQITLNGVNGSTNFAIPMSILIGDTNANGTVNVSDVSQTKSRVGHAIDGTNFRSDVNANGYINAADVSIVKSSVGTGLP